MQRNFFLSWLIMLNLLLGIFTNIRAQEKLPVSLEDIFKQGTFNQKSVYGINWMKDGQYYTSIVADELKNADYIIQFSIESGEAVDTIVNGKQLTKDKSVFRFEDYAFSADEQKVLIASEIEGIYRRSSKAYYYIYDLKTKKLQKLTSGGKQSYATFSPDGTKVAFVRENNLYYVNLATMEEFAITTSGKWNHIINGSSDWVYEEEFGFAKAFFWSPDGQSIAYYIFNESDVKEYNMQVWSGLYPQDYKFKYPKAGEKNSVIDIAVFHLINNETVSIDLGDEKDIYIPRIYWTKNASLLSIVRMNRLQNKLEILHGDILTGNTTIVLTEKSNTYIDINFIDDLTYLNDRKHFIRTSEKDGFKHLYLHKMDGSLVRQITKGDWEVDQVLGIDEKKQLIYYTSTEISPLERHLFVIGINGKKAKQMTSAAGMHGINLSSDYQYYIDYYSSSSAPLRISLHEAHSGKEIKILEDNKLLKETIANYIWSEKSFFSFKTNGGVSLNGYMIKPSDFDKTKQYPVLMYVYGGPGSQLVLNSWGGGRELWFQHLAQKGYIIVCVDNRGTGGRGKEFKDINYKQLGKYETEDQIEAARYLAKQPFVDKDRIGIWGWSYGGYMSSLCLFLGADNFKAAIAVAPVTSWRFYDTIYTERYLQTPQQNPEGYDEFSPLSHVNKLKGNFLLIHGTGDDNVHFQNSVALVDGLIAANKQFQTFYYPNRHHGISGGNTSFHLYNLMTNFIIDHL